MWSSSDSIDAFVVEPLTSVLPSSTTVPVATASRSRPTNVADLPERRVVLADLDRAGAFPGDVNRDRLPGRRRERADHARGLQRRRPREVGVVRRDLNDPHAAGLDLD